MHQNKFYLHLGYYENSLMHCNNYLANANLVHYFVLLLRYFIYDLDCRCTRFLCQQGISLAGTEGAC